MDTIDSGKQEMVFKKKIVLTEEQKKDLARLSAPQFARKYGINTQSVYYLRFIYGVIKLEKPYDMFENTKSEAYRDLQVLSAAELARKYGIVKSNVCRLRRRLGVKKLCIYEVDEMSVTPQLLSDLKTLQLAEAVAKYKISIVRVRHLRKKLRLKKLSFFDSLTDKERKELIVLTLDKAALKFSVCTRTISRAREKMRSEMYSPR